MTFPNAGLTSALVSVAALSLLTTACGGDDEDSDAREEVDGIDLVALSAPLVGGGEYDLAQHTESDLVLWFWAPW